jgi:hypothetical protein
VGLLVILSGAERPLWPNFAVKPPVSGKFPMKPIYAAWLGDLGPGDLVECVCGHLQALTASMLATAGMGEALRDDHGVAAPPPVPGVR